MQILVLLGRLHCTQTATTNVSSKWKCSLMFAQQQYLDSIGANLVRPLQGCVQQYGWLQVICNNDVLVLLEPNACRCHPQQPWRPSACSLSTWMGLHFTVVILLTTSHLQNHRHCCSRSLLCRVATFNVDSGGAVVSLDLCASEVPPITCSKWAM